MRWNSVDVSRANLALPLSSALVTAILVVALVVAYANLQSLSTTNSWVVHTQDVRVELLQMFSALQDAETAERGFIITNNRSYLGAYRVAQRALPQRLAHLQALTAENPAQQRLLAELRQRVSAKLHDVHQTIRARERDGFDATQRIVRSGRGEQEMDRIRDMITQMAANEEGLLAERIRKAQAASRAANVSFGATAILAIVGLLVVYDLARRRLRYERILAEERERVAAIETRLGSIVASASDGIITIDHDQHIILFNAAAEHMFGCTASEAMGQSLDRFIPSPLRERHRDHIRLFADTGVSARVMGGERVLSAVRANGEEFPIEARISQASVAGKKLLTVVVRDVTERRAAAVEREELLAQTEHARGQAEAAAKAEQRARQVAEAASEAKDNFLATVSHELRTPLSPILTWVHLLRRGDVQGEKAERAFDAIERSARSEAQLVEDLLDLSRIVSGKMRLEVRPVLLAPVIEKAVEIVRPAADAKGVYLQAVLDTVVAPILGDAERLQQVVWNLLSNAVKFSPKGGRVQVALERVNSHVEIAVSDTGQGIEPQFLPRVFERFQQADGGTNRAQGGLGLGLAIVRHIVEAHGGSVHAESPGVGKGAVFTVKLAVMMPRTAGEAERRHPTAGLATGDRQLPRLDRLRLLVVDDEPASNEVVQELLTSCGAEVRVAGSAEYAREILARWKPDILVSDVGMPHEDGYAFIASVRAGDGEMSQMPAVALTAYASREDKIRLLSAGFQAHVPKPLDPAELIAVIANLGSITGKL
jgi:PAS domain S-box-containing protein